jgi:hypothetical protein
MMQNLRRLFDRAALPFLTEEVIERFGRAFDSDSTGTHLSDILSDIATLGHTDGLPRRTQDLHGGKLQVLSEDILRLLHDRDDLEDGRSIRYEIRALFHSVVHEKGFKIRPLKQSFNDSNIVYRSGRNCDWSAGQVTHIFTGSWTEHQERMSQIFLVVEELAELNASDIHSDVYRRFPAFGARLCYDRVGASKIVTLDSFICQFARKAYRLPDLQQDLVLVFPITKV